MHRFFSVRTPATSLRLAFLAAFALLALALPSTGLAIVYIEGVTNDQLPDYDASAEITAAPTSAQSSAAKSLNASVTWSNLGTPSTIFNSHGYVATGIKAPTAAAAAGKWLRSHSRLFGTSLRNLRLVTAAPLRGTRTDHAVVFRQTFGGVLSDQQVAVEIVGSKQAGWKITYVSSSVARGTAALHGLSRLSPLQAWTKAVSYTGHSISGSQVTAFGRTSSGATDVIATGFMGDQSVHPTAFPTSRGVIRAYSAVVTKSTEGNQSQYAVVVDASTGKLLSRTNQVFNAVDDPTWLAPRHSMSYNGMNAYPWNYPTTDNRALFCWTAGVGCARSTP